MIAIVAIVTFVQFLNRDSEVVSRSRVEPQEMIEIIAVAPFDVTGDRIDAWVKNVGFGPISLVEKAEIFVRSNAVKYSQAGGGNTWVENPVGSSWNPEDTLYLIITLPSDSPLATGKHTFRVWTSTGTYANKSF